MTRKNMVKTLIFSLLAMLMLFSIAILVFIQRVDPNQFKQEIQSIVLTHTGQRLTINGDMDWSFFPWIGLEVKDITLANPKGFGHEPLLTIKRVDVGVQLLPLLAGKIHMREIALDGLMLKLIRFKDGRTNWDHLRKSNPAKQSSPHSTVHLLKSLANFNIARLHINNAMLQWNDQLTQQQLTLHHIKLQGQYVNLKQPFTLSGHAESSYQAHPIILDISTLVQPTTTQQLKLQNTHIKLAWHRPATDHPLVIESRLNLILSADGLVNANNIIVHALNMNGKATLNIKHLFTQPYIKTHIHIAHFSPKTLLSGLSYPINFAHPEAFTDLAADFTVTADHNKITTHIDNLVLDLSQAQGDLSIHHLRQPSKSTLNFNLSIDTLPLSRYAIASKMTQTNKTSSSPQKQTFHWLPNKINGTLDINHLLIHQITLHQVHLKVNKQKNQIKINPIAGKLYQGQLNGQLTMQLTPIPTYRAQLHLSQTQLEPLLRDLLGTKRIHGKLDITMALQSKGCNKTQRLSQLSGQGSVQVKQGIIQGFSLLNPLNKAILLLSGNSAQTASMLPIQDTRFNQAKGSFQINGGQLHNSDLILQSKQLSATGNGTIDLIKQKINYTLAIKRPGKQWSLPMTIRGDLFAPQALPGFDSLSKLGKQAIKKLKKINLEPIEKKVSQSLRTLLH